MRIFNEVPICPPSMLDFALSKHGHINSFHPHNHPGRENVGNESPGGERAHPQSQPGRGKARMQDQGVLSLGHCPTYSSRVEREAAAEHMKVWT